MFQNNMLYSPKPPAHIAICGCLSAVAFYFVSPLSHSVHMARGVWWLKHWCMWYDTHVHLLVKSIIFHSFSEMKQHVLPKGWDEIFLSCIKHVTFVLEPLAIVQGMYNGNDESLRQSTPRSTGAGSKTFGLLRVLCSRNRGTSWYQFGARG